MGSFGLAGNKLLTLVDRCKRFVPDFGVITGPNGNEQDLRRQGALRPQGVRKI